MVDFGDLEVEGRVGPGERGGGGGGELAGSELEVVGQMVWSLGEEIQKGRKGCAVVKPQKGCMVEPEQYHDVTVERIVQVDPEHVELAISEAFFLPELAISEAVL
jgi:hypothetical protein